MTEENRKDFGKRAPLPVVIHKPATLGSAPLGPATQKRSLAISLAVMGALSLGTYEAIDWLDRKLNCEPDPAKPDELICKHHSGSSYRRSSNWRWSSGSGSGGGWHWSSGGGSTHGVSFGGFGHFGSGGG